jgi:dTDP-4-dehydrorhamnose reductase
VASRIGGYHGGHFKFCTDSMASRRNMLLLGASGVLGKALAGALGARAVGKTYLRHPIEDGMPFDARTSSIAELLARLPRRPDAAVILLGETRIDECARDPAGTAQTNVAGIAKVARQLATLDITPVFVSSDAVFDGSRAYWSEDDVPNPILTYGRQKLEAERALAALASRWMVVRLPKLLSPMVEQWADQLSRPGTMDCASDQFFTPMLAADAAAAIIALVDQQAKGVFHIAGPERVSRRALLRAVEEEYGRFAKPAASITERPMREIEKALGLREPRPLDTSMRSVRLDAIRLPAVQPASVAARALVRERLAR